MPRPRSSNTRRSPAATPDAPLALPTGLVVSDEPAAEIAPVASPEALDAAYWPFVRWMSRPLSPGKPKTLPELAASLGVSPDDLRALALRPSYPDDLKAATLDWAAESLPAVLHPAFAEASSPDAPMAARQKYVDMVTAAQRAAKDAPQSATVNVFGMDDERFARILARAAAKARPSPLAAHEE